MYGNINFSFQIYSNKNYQLFLRTVCAIKRKYFRASNWLETVRRMMKISIKTIPSAQMSDLKDDFLPPVARHSGAMYQGLTIGRLTSAVFDPAIQWRPYWPSLIDCV